MTTKPFFGSPDLQSKKLETLVFKSQQQIAYQFRNREKKGKKRAILIIAKRASGARDFRGFGQQALLKTASVLHSLLLASLYPVQESQKNCQEF